MSAHSSISFQEDASSIYTLEQLALIDSKKVPEHVAVIMDGNRRWAKQQGLPPMMGHWEGAEVLIDTVRAAIELGVKTLTVYSFSTENWGRSKAEIDALMNIFEVYLIRKRDVMIREGIRLDAIGDLSQVPKKVQGAFEETKRMTQEGNKINLVIALNYGARDEIRRAIVKIIEEQKENPQEITEELIAKHLDTQKWGDPELLIRTSGQLRLSNFLLWQLSYAHLHVTDILWPEFSAQNLYDAVLGFTEKSLQREKGV